MEKRLAKLEEEVRNLKIEAKTTTTGLKAVASLAHATDKDAAEAKDFWEGLSPAEPPALEAPVEADMRTDEQRMWEDVGGVEKETQTDSVRELELASQRAKASVIIDNWTITG